ncbi:MMPL family transporter [Streptomyces halobius]|uniref:MMPL family transporter n=1 Tax=Streptomyces halobius TaxID=2879846 RepID=A0ABY4M0W5_9ACTN|nr:MMPL family transporter [Streptomyces halobius]UQA91404.1 MMPL family transporter [Streptomyces halobius]
MFARLGRIVARRAWAVVLVSLTVAGVALFAASGVGDRLSYGGFIPSDAESNRAAVAVRERIGRGGADVVVLYRHQRRTVDDPAFRRAVEESLSAVPAGAGVSTMTYWSRELPLLVSRDRHATAVAVMLAGSDDTQRAHSYQRFRSALRADGYQLQYAGPTALVDEVSQRGLSDLEKAKFIGFPAVLLLLVMVFRSPVAAVLPVVIGGLSIGITLGCLVLLRDVVETSFTTLIAVTTLGLALDVDAALFVVGRFREELARRATVPDAVETTCATAGRTVFLSGVTMCGIAGGVFFFPIDALRAFGVGAALVIAVSVVLNVTALPAALFLLGHRINSMRVPWSRPGEARAGGGWARLARSVMNRPGHYLVGVLLVLAALTAPFFHIVLGVPDQRALPADASARMATDSLQHDFPVNGLNAIQVAVTVPERLDTPAGQRSLTAWASRVVALPDIGGGLIAAKSQHSAVVYFDSSGNLDAAGTRALVRDIRALPPPGKGKGEVLVGGVAAMALDTLEMLNRRLPWALLYITAFTFVFLLVALRSIVLPLKALVIGALSMSASFGALVWIFQDGHLLWLVNGSRTGYVDVVQPIVLLLLLAGVSMDYEFFLLSRIREHYDASGDNTAAVAQGLQQSGPVVSVAALVVLVVSAIFASNGVTTVKQVCVGMFIAIALEATLIRALLVPAVMRLLGRANWWLPGARKSRSQALSGPSGPTS